MSLAVRSATSWLARPISERVDRPARPPEPPGEARPGEPTGIIRGQVVPGLILLGALLGLSVWCTSALAIGLNKADSFWEWLAVTIFGLALPLMFLHSVRRYVEVCSWRHVQLRAPARRAGGDGDGEDKDGADDGIRGDDSTDAPCAGRAPTSLPLAPPRQLAVGGQSASPLAPEVPAEPAEPLSERECEVLALLATGRSNREIAAALVVGVGTVKTHTNNIYRKLAARNRVEAVTAARALRLI